MRNKGIRKCFGHEIRYSLKTGGYRTGIRNITDLVSAYIEIQANY